MKWYPNQVKTALNNVDDLPAVFFIYGDDSGLVRRLAKGVAQFVCPQDDPFMLDKLNAEELRNTPSLLQESFETIGFGMGRKLILLDASHMETAVQSAFTGALKALFASLDNAGGATTPVLVVTAAGLEATSAIAKAATAHKDVAAIRCFLDQGKDLNLVINEKLQESGQKLSQEARSFLIESLGKDRGITESELEKLVLYTKGSSQITLEHCLEVIAAAPSVNIFKLCDAIGLRDRAQADKILSTLLAEGTDMNMALAMVTRHLRRLGECHIFCENGLNPNEAMTKLKPPVFMGKDLFIQQLKRTPHKRVEQSLTRLFDLQQKSRLGQVDVNLTLGRGLLALSA